MKTFLPFLIFLLILGCHSGPNPVEGKLFSFAATIDHSEMNEERILFEDLAFIDEEHFILGYLEGYNYKFVRGTYRSDDPYVYLQFEETAYETVYPEVPATSAPDTTEYLPTIMESKCAFGELKMKLSTDKEMIRLDKTGMEQIGSINKEQKLEDFIQGIEIQSLEFLLENED